MDTARWKQFQELLFEWLLMPSSCHLTLADPVTQCFDIQFVLQMMENIVTDRAVVAQADQRHSLSR